MKESRTLKILQYNVRKSRDTVMATLLRDARIGTFDVVAIQEPWKNPFTDTTHHPAKDIFHLCYATSGTHSRPTRVCFFVHKRLDHTRWRFNQHGGDICSLTFRFGDGDEAQSLAIFNIYNTPKGTEDRISVLPALDGLLSGCTTHECIVVGDFNLHHRMWGGERVVQADAEAVELIEVMERHALQNTLETGTITYEEGTFRSTIDLCLVTLGLVDKIIRSGVDRELDHDSDHLPITTTIGLQIPRRAVKARRNWKHLSDKGFCEALGKALPQARYPRTKTALDAYLEEVTLAIRKAADQVLPKAKPSPKMKDGWNKECSEALAEAKRLKRKNGQLHTEDDWEAYRAARNHKTRVIRKALRQAHRDRVEEASQSPEALWRLAKWARNRRNQASSITPPIINGQTREEVAEASAKAALFRDVFFPDPPLADLDDIATAKYPEPIALPKITEKEVTDAITATKALKAPGPDEIANKALQAGKIILVKHLTSIFNSSIALAYCPEHFRQSTTVVLRKPGKENYTVPKAYRPIALLNTIGKIMDAVIARRLSYVAETYNLLPSTHIGGRRQKSTEHALHNITDKIYDAWNTGRGQVASLLLLDVSGAFDNVSHERLLHDLRSRRIDDRLVRWIASFLSNRSTKITVDGFESPSYFVSTGIPQGSPLSPILYIFYNSGLIEMKADSSDTAITGYIDDAAILTWGDSTEDTCSRLAEMLVGAQRWATTHASKFAPEKFQLTHFTRARTRFELERGVETPWCNIAPSATCKYLGVTMDTKLHWKPHIQEIQNKVTKTIGALHTLGSSTWGVRMLDMRKLYGGVAIPQMLYACSVWSQSRAVGNGYTKQSLHALQTLQARAARAVCGAFRATSAAALDVEAFLLPVERQIEKHNAGAMVRILASTGAIGPSSGTAGRDTTRKYTSPFHRIRHTLASQAKVDLDTLEYIPPFVSQPWRLGPSIYIDGAEEARSRHNAESAKPKNICIYTDGSGIGGHVGAAAVCPSASRVASAYMGAEAVSTVYIAELQGINLALRIAQKALEDKDSIQEHVAIWTDNQAAIRSLIRPEGKSGAYILKQIAGQVDELQNRGHTVTVRWIPSHEGIEGNEAADIAAKEATGWREGEEGSRECNRARPPDELCAVKATIKRDSQRELNRKWQISWREETKGRTTYRHTQTPSKKVLQLHAGLSKRESALLVQLRTEKIGLNDFLFSRSVPGILDPMCPCREGRQTVRHVLLTCRRLRDLRRTHLGRFSGRTNLRIILNKHKLATRAIRFIELAQILGQRRIGEEQTMSSAGGRQ